MDAVTLALAKAYADKNAVAGYISEKFTITKGNDAEWLFTSEELIGCEVTVWDEYHCFLKTPEARPDIEDGSTIISTNVAINYTSNGILTAPVLLVMGVDDKKCLGFSTKYSGYQAIMYVYDETSDLLGMGMTLQKRLVCTKYHHVCHNTF